MSKGVTDMRGDRREFFRGFGRGVAIAALVGVSALALLRHWRRQREHTCISHGLCRGCSKLKRCGLPAALSAKQAGVRGV